MSDTKAPDEDKWMGCPNCYGSGCKTCGGDGAVPTWLKDAKVNGEEAAGTWES